MYNSHDQWYKWDESTYKNVRLASGHTLIKTGSNGFGLMVAASSKNETLLPFTSDSEQENFCWSIRIIQNEGRDSRTEVFGLKLTGPVWESMVKVP